MKQTDVEVIIVGGGIIGVSLAYHLATAPDPRRVLLLERGEFTCGTTWHAAGLVAELRASANLTRLARYSGELYESLEAAGHATGYKRLGALTLAKHDDRAYELKKQAAMARYNGVPCTWWSAPALRERWPQLDTSDLVGGLYLPRDGQTNPVDTTLALAKLARQHGADLRERTAVSRVLVEQGRAVGVECSLGAVRADQVVLCAGLWTRALGLAAGAHFPLYPAEHFYAVTEPVSLPADTPIVRIPDDGVYLKPDAGRLLVGCFERQAKPLDPAGLPEDFSFEELPFDLPHFAPYLERGLARIPKVADAGIRTFFNGPESFTPDGRYLLGESPQVEQLFVAAGFNSIGIQSAGGVGQVMTEWLAKRRPPMDLWDVDVRPLCALSESAALSDRPHVGKASAGSTPCTGRTIRWRARATSGVRRCTTVWRRGARASANWPGGSGPTGTPGRSKRRNTSTATARRTGSKTRAPSIGPYGATWRCSISRALRNTMCRGQAPVLS